MAKRTQVVEPAQDKVDDVITVPTAPAPASAPIAPHVANNVMEFLKRVELKGLEAFAFCEAYSTLQQHANGFASGVTGVPFKGLQ